MRNEKVVNMSVGDIAQSVWSVSRRSATVDQWDKQQLEDQRHQTNPNLYSSAAINELVSSRSKRVSRSLFGPSDPLENRRVAYEETDNKRSSDRNRWNFDFYREKPISGRFDWKKVNNSIHSINSISSTESKKSFGETGEQSDNFWSSKKKSAKS